MSEQQLDVGRAVGVLRRYRRLLAAFVVGGLALSGGYAAISAVRYSATALVLVPITPDASDPTNPQAVTDAEVATSTSVLGPAGAAVQPVVPIQVLRSSVTATAGSGSIIDITAARPTAREAMALANAVAEQLVQFLTTLNSQNDGATLQSLEARAARTQQAINALAGQITVISGRLKSEAPNSAAAVRDRALVSSLTTQQSQGTIQLNSLDSQIAQANLASAVSNTGTEVIQRATSANGPSVARLPETLLIGALGGFVIGCAVVVRRNRRDRRVTRRQDIAEAVGVPVLTSLDVTVPRSVGDWMDLLRGLPGATDRWRLRQCLHRLLGDEPKGKALLVASLRGDHAGRAVGLMMATTASMEGVPTAIVVSGSRVDNLQRAFERLMTSGRWSRRNLAVVTALSGEAADDLLTVIPVSVDPDAPFVPSPVRPSAVVLVVGAGAARDDDLAAVALAAADAGQPVQAVIVANPDADDDTSGFPDSITHTSTAREGDEGSPVEGWAAMEGSRVGLTERSGE